MAPKILVVDDNQELLTLLTQLLEEAGYEVMGAAKGRQAIDQALAQTPQLALLDVLLPDMMGFQLAELLRRDLPSLPLMFMTGVFKGGKHSHEAKVKYAAEYFEKPFDASKLIQAIGRVVPPEKKAASGPAHSAFEVELDIDVEEDRPQEPMELTGRIKVTGGGNLTAEIRGDNLMAQPMPFGQATVVRHAPAGKPDLAGPTRSTDPTSRRGDIRDNLPQLITAFYTLQETGELGCQRGKVKKVVYFEKGQPVFALSNLVSDRFGQFLMRVGKINADQLREVTTAATSTKRRTGDILVERGLLKDTERLYYVAQQVKAIIYSLFGWEDGSYIMSFRDKAGKESIKLDIHPANLIVRGIKKLYKPDRLRRLIHPEDRLLPSLQPLVQLNELDLERWEAELLPRIDGTRTVGEVLALTQRPEHVVLGFLCALLSLSILERRSS